MKAIAPRPTRQRKPPLPIVQRPADDTGPEREYDPREVDGPTPETNPLCLSTAAQEYRDHGPGGNSLPAF